MMIQKYCIDFSGSLQKSGEDCQEELIANLRKVKTE